MTYKFYLREPKRTKGKTRIMLVIFHANRTFQRSLGLAVEPKDFKKQRTKDEEINAKLRSIETSLLGLLTQFSTEKDITNALDHAVAIAKGKSYVEESYDASRPFLWDYFEEWSLRGSERAKDRNLAYRRIVDMMGRYTDWEDIDGAWYFLFSEKCRERNYSHNYKSTLTAKLKTVMNEAFNRGIHKNEAFRKFPTSYKPADTIALTQEEVDALWNATLCGKLADARDVFIVGIYCAGRFQDYSQISSDNIADGKLRYVQRKTGETVIIPCAPRILEVLERHGGKLPRITEQEVGKHIKFIAKMIGGSFLNVVEVSKIRADKKEIEAHQRWELISTHTARRTGITILHLQGVPAYQLMMVSGHRTIDNFQKYLRIGKEQNAQYLMDIDFFRQG